MPATLVNLHVLGSALVWVYTLRLVFATRSRGPAGTTAVGNANELDRVPA